MGYSDTAMIAMVSTVLQDPSTATYGTALIWAKFTQSLRELNNYSPNLAKSTVTFSSTVKELSIASLTDLIDVINIEYPVDKDPRRYRNYDVRGSSVILDISFAPSSGDTAYIWYSAPHTVSGTATNTLNKEEERLLIELTAAQVAMDYSFSKISSMAIGGKWVDFHSWGKDKENKALAELRRLKEPEVAIRWPTVY